MMNNNEEKIKILSNEYTKKEIVKTGKRLKIKKKIVFGCIGGSIILFGGFLFISDGLNIGALASISMFFFIPGLVFLLIAFVHKPYYNVGLEYLKKQAGLKIDTPLNGNFLNGDKILSIKNPTNDKIIVDSKNGKFQIISNGSYSDIMDSKELVKFNKVRNDPLNPNFRPEYSVSITVNNLNKPIYDIKKISEEMADSIIAVLTIISKFSEKDSVHLDGDKYDEIKRYMDLLNAGAITEDEFELKRRKLLGINEESTENIFKICPYCNHKNLKKHRYCEGCGSSLN